MKSHTVIIGGGLTGILCALRLSKESIEENQEISLIDSHETLGGRFFFADSANGIKSGWGFEHESLDNLDTLKRHIFLCLTEDEKNYLDNFLQEKIQKNPFKTFRPKKYFIKKEILNAEYILLSNSEFLTKKEAEILHSLVHFKKKANYENEKETLLENFDLWKNAGKNSQESVLSILECILGKYVLKLPLVHVCAKLHEVFCEHSTYNDPFFLRISEIENAFLHILKNRNVAIHTQCTLTSFAERKDGFELCVAHVSSRGLTAGSSLDPAVKPRDDRDDTGHISCNKIIFTIPPYNIRTLLPKEHFSSELARFVSKVQPISLVYLEIYDFKNKLIESMQNQFQTLDTIYFPVEGVNAFVTSDERLVFSAELDYETSLQAPAVRETLTHLRRAARRMLRPEFSAELKKGSFIRKTESFEKMILLPIAQNLPSHIQTSQLPELKNVTFNMKNIYVAGDYFYSLGDTTWKRIVKSADLVVSNVGTVV